LINLTFYWDVAYIVSAEPQHFYAAAVPAPDKNFDAAPAPAPTHRYGTV
jgi:hypothetical protein